MSAPISDLLISNPGSDTAIVTDKELVAVRAAQQAEALSANSALPAYGKQGTDLVQFHQMMRGRYRLAITLLLIGAIAGTAIGFKCGRKVYSSKGMIEVKASIPKVLYSVDDKGILPMFDSYVESQAAWLRSQDVINQAMMDLQWQNVRPGKGDAEMEEFSKELTITHEGQIIFVQVVDPDPSVAQTAVSTLIHAYEELYRKQDARNDDSRYTTLKTLVADSDRDLKAAQLRIRGIADPYGTTDLRSLVQAKQELINRLDEMIQEQNTLLNMSVRHSATTRPGVATADELAARSPQLAQLIQKEEDCDEQIAIYEGQKLGPEHPMMIEAKDRRERYARKIDVLIGRLQANGATVMQTTTASGVAVNLADVEWALKLFKEQRVSLDNERIEIGRQSLEIEKLQNDAKDFQEKRDSAQHRIDELNVEETLSTRIDVLSRGDRPLSTYRNTQIPFSAAGGFGGGFLGFGIVALLALMDQRLRSPAHAEVTRFNAPILGMLPRLPDDLQNPAHAAMAAHCVHEIRTLLQIWSRQSMHRVFAITSPHAGAGKTSLTLALGASYAASNLRTLVVDCDLVAGGLTRRLDVVIPRDFGDVLVREGLVKHGQITATAKIAGADAEAQGDMLVAWNVISDEQKERAYERMLEEPVGILDAIHGMPIAQCVQETGIHNLHIMPVGSATARDVPLLSPEALHRLLSLLGREFDVVLVDTGPILGSLEASLVAGAVDGVVLTVAKGDLRPMVERAMSQLATVGARVAGMVFNGATVDELIAYGNGSSTYSGGSSDRITLSDPAKATVPSRYGPLTCAVATSAPAIRRSSIVRAE